MGDTFTLEDSAFGGYIDDDEVMLGQVVGAKVVEKPFEDDDGNKVKKVEFKFTLMDPDGKQDGLNLWGETPVRFNTHPDCRLRNWAQAMLGQELPAGFNLDLDMLLNTEVRTIIGYKEWDKTDGTKGKRNFVKDVMPTKDAERKMAAEADEPF